MQIEVLDLSRNRIESIAECAFCSCSKLTHIDISSNGLLELGNMFGDRRYEKLKYLSLSHNLLQVPVNKTSPLTRPLPPTLLIKTFPFSGNSPNDQKVSQPRVASSV